MLKRKNKNIENKYEVKNASSFQYGISLKETASSLTQGGTGGGTENRFAWMWPSK